MPCGRRCGQGRSVDRLINFSDAVVAVAVTVLVLPLVDIRPAAGETVWDVISENASQVWTFLFTFYVVAVMWLAHNRILNSIGRYDPFIFWINTTWLAAIVLLPWVSAMYGESEWGRTGVGLVYWGTMAAIALLGSLLGSHLRRPPRSARRGGASDVRGGKAPSGAARPGARAVLPAHRRRVRRHPGGGELAASGHHSPEHLAAARREPREPTRHDTTRGSSDVRSRAGDRG